MEELMELTNKNGIPESVFHWLSMFNAHNEASRSESIAEFEKKLGGKYSLKISVTSLIKPAREIVLMDRHRDEVSREASDIYDAIIGTAVHDSFDKMPMRDDEEREVRLGQLIVGVLVHGQFDNVYRGELSDYKTMKVGGYIFGDREFEFTAQLSCYRLLYFLEKGIMLNDIGKIIMLFTDWRDREYATKKYGWGDAPNYPQRSQELSLKLWDRSQTEKWIIRRVTEYKLASMVPDNELPPCKDEERWARENKKTHKVTYAKCDKYCSAAPFCNQAKEGK
jgi:hypothetical protein